MTFTISSTWLYHTTLSTYYYHAGQMVFRGKYLDIYLYYGAEGELFETY